MELYKAYLRLLVAFPLVILLAYFGLRFLLSRFAPDWSAGKKIRVVEKTALHPRAFLYVVQVGENYFLLAATQTSVTFIKDLGRAWADDSLAMETGDDPRSAEPSIRRSFAGLLERLKGKGNHWKGPGDQG